MYKKIGALLCVFLLSFNIFTYKPKADVATGAVIGGLLLEGSSLAGAGTAIIAAAPYVAAFATVCIGLGIVYENREEIQASLVAVYNYAKEQGKNFLDYFSQEGDKVVVSSEAISLTRGAINEYLIDSSSLNTVGHLGTFQFASGSVANPSFTNVSIPLSGSDDIILEVTCSGIGSANAPSAQVLLDGSNLHYFSEMFYGTSSKTFWIGLSYDSTGWRYKTSKISLSDLLSKAPTNTGSICADLTLNVEQKWNKSGSISVDRLLGDSIGNLGNVGADVIPKNPSITGEKDVSVSIPMDRPLTWDNVLEKDWTQTGDITAEDVKTDTGTGEGSGSGSGDLTTPTISLDLSPLYLDLSTKFPFCIPFDIYNLIKSFEVSKKRPVYTVVMPELYFNSYTFDIDLAFYDDYFPFSSVLRYFLLVAFLYFLITNTKKHIS